MSWAIWGLLLWAQSASSTFVSRARNSSSYLYHGIASVFSNGVWIVSLAIMVDKFKDGISPFTIAFYIVFTVSGSVGMHWFLMHAVEKKVGPHEGQSVFVPRYSLRARLRHWFRRGSAAASRR